MSRTITTSPVGKKASLSSTTAADVVPAPQSFEVALCRKILSQTKPLLHTFLAIDEDNDGTISKIDLANGLHNIFGIDLENEEIDIIFLRFASLTNLNREVLQNEENEGMRFKGFAKYVQSTADSAARASLVYGAAGISAGKKEYIKTVQSKSARRKELRQLIYNLIHQHAPSASDGGMAATYIFLGMDRLRDNQIRLEEFRLWINSKMALELSVEEMKLVMGGYWVEVEDSDEGLSFQECVAFVEGLAKECMRKSSYKEEGRDEPVKQRHKPFSSKLIDEVPKRDENDENETGLEEEEVYLEGDLQLRPRDKEAIIKYRGLLHPELQVLKNLFKNMTKSNPQYFTGAELKAAMEKCGLKISDDQIIRIMKHFGNDKGEMEFFNFVKLLTRKL